MLLINNVKQLGVNISFFNINAFSVVMSLIIYFSCEVNTTIALIFILFKII